MPSPVFFIFTLRKPKDQLSPNKPWSQDPLYHHWHWQRWQAPCLLAWQLQFPAVCWVFYISESSYRILMAHKLLFEMLFIGCPSQNQGWIQQCHCLDETAWVGRGDRMSQLWGCSPAVPIKLMWKGNFEKLTKWSRLPRAWQCRWKCFNGNIPCKTGQAHLGKSQRALPNHAQLVRVFAEKQLGTNHRNEIWGEKSWKTPSYNAPWVRSACPFPHISQKTFGIQQEVGHIHPHHPCEHAAPKWCSSLFSEAGKILVSGKS